MGKHTEIPKKRRERGRKSERRVMRGQRINKRRNQKGKAEGRAEERAGWGTFTLLTIIS
jgi:hypothetical protein